MNDTLILALTKNSELIDNAIADHYIKYSDPDTASVRTAEVYSLSAGGKRIRSFLVNEFCRACGGDISNSLTLALAVEMIHTFSLIHDDLPCMDNDDLRRGKPTSHKVFGEATALLAGDSLVVRAFELIAKDSALDARFVVDAISVLSESVSSEGMIGGQIIDMRGECEKLSFEELLALHSKKTGALIAASAKLGCIAACVGASDPRYIAATNYAAKIGLAFQIIDDILDATADVALLGKNVGVDADRNKTTFLTFMSIDEAYSYAARLTEEAKREIAVLENNAVLCELADYLLKRNK
jgi:geranylgeranyl diphosphate synthase type II